MPEKITVSSLSYQAALRVHLLETLICASKGLWGANPRMRYAFWLSARLAAITPEAQLSWLPALALAVERETEPDVLHQMADWPRPDTIPQEAIPWLAVLTSAWKQHLDVRFRGALARPLHQKLGYQGIVRWSHPAGCHLAEWLQYVRWIAGDHEVPGSWLAAFAGALANWQGEEPLQAEKHTVREWISFWEEQSSSAFLLTRLMVRQARLNMMGAGLPANTAMVEVILHELADDLRRATWRDFANAWETTESAGLVWCPQKTRTWPTSALRELARAWLDIADTTDHLWGDGRYLAWKTLVQWEAAGWLAGCGIDVAGYVARAIRKENYLRILPVLSQWRPGPKGSRRSPSEVTSIVAGWWRLQKKGGLSALDGWIGVWQCFLSGVMTEKQKLRFRKEWEKAILHENNECPLWFLAQAISSPGKHPREMENEMEIWMQRFRDGKSHFPLAALTAFWNFRAARSEQEGGEIVEKRHRWRQIICRFRQAYPGNILSPDWQPNPVRLQALTESLVSGQKASLNVRADSGEKNIRHPAGLMVLPEVFPSCRKYEAPDGRPGELWADAGSTSDPGAEQGAG